MIKEYVIALSTLAYILGWINGFLVYWLINKRRS